MNFESKTNVVTGETESLVRYEPSLELNIKKKIRRIVGCQGSCQLLTALAALDIHCSTSVDDNLFDYEDYLVIYGLAIDRNQEIAFVDTIKNIANHLHEWHCVIYLSDEVFLEKQKYLRFFFQKGTVKKIHSLIGVDQVDEIYLARNWSRCNVVLMQAYQNALKICYGDGYGMYSPEQFVYKTKWSLRHFFKTRNQIFLDLRNDFAIWLENRLPKPIKFDLGYFCSMYLSVLSKSEYSPIPFAVIDNKSQINKMFAQLDDFYQLNTQGVDTLVILLTSNFSEAGVTEFQKECDGYVESLARFLLANNLEHPTIWVKPHPRDNTQKIAILKKLLIDSEYSLLEEETKFLQYFPFEFIYYHLKQNMREKIFVIGAGSTSLALAYFFDVNSQIMFGEIIGKKTFVNPNYLKARLEWENHYSKLVQYVLEANKAEDIKP